MRPNTTDLFGFMNITAGNVTSTSFDGSRFRNVFTCTNGLGGSDPRKRRNPTAMSYGYGRLVSQTFWSYDRTTANSGGNDRLEYFLLDSNGSGSPYDVQNPSFIGGQFVPSGHLTDRCLQKIFDKLAIGQGNLLVDLAEGSQTLKMLKATLSFRQLLLEFVTQFVRPRKKDDWKRWYSKSMRLWDEDGVPKTSKIRVHTRREAREPLYKNSVRLKYVTNKWLEYRYGWTPLIMSVYETLETMAKEVDNKTRNVLITGQTARRRKTRRTGTMPGRRILLDTVTVVETVQKCRITCVLSAPTTKSIYDYTSLNPLALAWELLPFSFVADWFVTVGQALELYENYIKFANSFVAGFRTDTSVEDVTFSATGSFSFPVPTWPNGSYVPDVIVDHVDRRKTRQVCCTKERSLITSLPLPGLPRVDVKLNAKRMLDSAALIRGLFAR